MKKNWIIIYWIIAILLTVSASIYQRKTGPSHPVSTSINIQGKDYNIKLPRSGGDKDMDILLYIDKSISPKLYFRKYPSGDNFSEIDFVFLNNKYIAKLPVQPPAGKLEYYISIEENILFKEEPLIIRFKDNVPAWALIPHIIFMFAAMLFANYGLIMTLLNKKQFKTYLYLTSLCLIIGGFVFGPIVQKFAFGVYWSGFPLGYDLTDNKTLIALIGMIIGIVFIKKKISRWVAMAGFIIMIGIFSIPHSLRGSELNPKTGVLESAGRRN